MLKLVFKIKLFIQDQVVLKTMMIMMKKIIKLIPFWGLYCFSALGFFFYQQEEGFPGIL